MSRGSVSIYLTIVGFCLIVVGALIGEYSEYDRQRSFTYHQMILEVDDELSYFDRDLFSLFGLLGCYDRSDKLYSQALSEPEVLEKQIVELMKKRELVSIMASAEHVIGEYISNRVGFDAELFDVSTLNRQLHDLLEMDRKETLTIKEVKNFLSNLVSIQPYVNLQGMSISALKENLVQLEFDAIKKVNPVFVIRQEIVSKYDELVKTASEFDLLGTMDHYLFADYAISYLGYSTTESKTPLRSEYVASGIENKTGSEIICDIKLFSLRMLLNFSECIINPKIRDKLMQSSGGEPRIMIIAAIGLSSIEAFLDTARIKNGGKIPVYKGEQGFMSMTPGKLYYKNGFTYPEYLKMLLMLIDKHHFLHRMQTVIEKTEKIKLSDYYTRYKIEKEIEYQGKYLPITFKEKLQTELFYDDVSGVFEH